MINNKTFDKSTSREFLKGELKMISSVPIIEDFLSVQGEGPLVGSPAYFIRFRKCNYKNGCPVGCDTLDKMRELNEYDLDFHELSEKFKLVNHLVITGGEPTLYIDHIVSLFKFLSFDLDMTNSTIEIETNGYQLSELLSNIPSDFFLLISRFQVNYSPKSYKIEEVVNLFDSLNKHRIDCYEDYICIKVVTWEHPKVERFIDDLGKISFPKENIWLMPWGSTINELQSSFPCTFRLACKYGFRVSPRLHIMMDCL